MNVSNRHRRGPVVDMRILSKHYEVTILLTLKLEKIKRQSTMITELDILSNNKRFYRALAMGVTDQQGQFILLDQVLSHKALAYVLIVNRPVIPSIILT